MRGPYLQVGTPTSAIIRWRTATPSDSRVSLGATPTALTTHVDVPAPTTEHQVTVPGLSPATRYYYAVGTSVAALAGGAANQFFVTPPLPGTAQPMRLWAFGDSGTANKDAARVRDAYRALTGELTAYTDVWLFLGDNAYPSGEDESYQRAVFDMYPMFLRQSFLWTTIGNHDTLGLLDPPGEFPYTANFTLPTAGEAGGLASGTERYYSFDFGEVHLICLDSTLSDRKPGSAMLMWLEADLRATSAPWVIAFWHHPPYSRGNHNSDSTPEMIEMRQHLVPILENHGVDLVLTGHSHSYERSVLLDGHYGASDTLTAAMKKDSSSGRASEGTPYRKKAAGKAPHDGAVYVVAGSAGQLSGGALNHPAMFVSLNHLGSMVIDLRGGRLEARFLRDNGFIEDSFTILKGPQANALPQVQMTSPSADARLSTTSVPLLASASDPDGRIAKVEFFVDTLTSLGSDDREPYESVWHATAGFHQITAVATDDQGASVTSVALAVKVPPEVDLGPGFGAPSDAAVDGPGGRFAPPWDAAINAPQDAANRGRGHWRTRSLGPDGGLGCGCAVGGAEPPSAAIALVLLALLGACAQRRRRDPVRP